jgi:hypothetical protein
MAIQVFDSLQRARFGGELEFPVSRLEVIGGLRDHVHIFPHTPGGAPEKLGRNLYEFHFTCPFYEGMPRYPNLWSKTLPALRQIFETGFSSDLVVPTIGTITAYCTNWREVMDAKAGRNGETVELTFREDQSNLFLVQELVAQTTQGFSSTLDAFNAALVDEQGRAAAASALLTAPDIEMLAVLPVSDLAQFSAISIAAAALILEIGAAVTYGAAVAAMAAQVVTLCQIADATASSLNDPTRYPLLYALQDLWQQAQQIAKDARQTQIQVKKYTVPPPGQSVSVISTALYGDTSHAIEIMQTNQIENPFLVPAGTIVTAYLIAPAQSAPTLS